MKKIIITGVSSFIGFHLAKFFSANFKVYGTLSMSMSGLITDLRHDLTACHPKSPWYSKGDNQFQSHIKLSSDYGILTRYKPETSTGQEELGFFRKYSAASTTSFGLFNGFGSWQDPLAYEFGLNGKVTPDQNTTARQVFHRIDVVAQGNNTKISYLRCIHQKI